MMLLVTNFMNIKNNKYKIMKYKVRLFQDETYEVLETIYKPYNYSTTTLPDDLTPTDEVVNVFKGSLSDCEAYIRLNEGGYM